MYIPNITTYSKTDKTPDGDKDFTSRVKYVSVPYNLVRAIIYLGVYGLIGLVGCMKLTIISTETRIAEHIGRSLDYKRDSLRFFKEVKSWIGVAKSYARELDAEKLKNFKLRAWNEELEKEIRSLKNEKPKP